MPNNTPIYNLRVVLKETGLKADVLRAWERRYNLPKPQRTLGGHRLYSEYDIEIVKWLKTRQAEGLSISRAVNLWSEITGTGHDPLVEYLPPAIAAKPEGSPVLDTRIDILRTQWLEANLDFNSNRVDEILNQAFAILPVETVCTEILQRGVREIGNYWYANHASVQQEHFASALANRRLETLIAAAPRPSRPQTILIGCPPGERHTLSVLMLTLFLCRRGLKVVYLGADIPIDQLRETATATHADLIVLAAQQLSSAAALQSAALILQRKGISLAYGGLIFNRIPILRECIPGHFLGESLESALQMIERLVASPNVSSKTISQDESQKRLAREYTQKRALIEKTLYTALEMGDQHFDFMNEANYFFGNGLSAALELGNPHFLEADLEWVTKLLAGRRYPSEHIKSYLTAYCNALNQEIGELSASYTDWIRAYLAKDTAI